MTISRVQGNGFGATIGTATIPVTLGAAVGANGCVVGMAGWDYSAGVTVTSVTDDKGNAYTVSENIPDAGVNQRYISFIRGGISNGPTTITVNLSSAASFRSIIVTEYSGVTAVTDPRDGHTGQVQTGLGTGTDLCLSGNITTTQAGDLIWGGLGPTNVASAGTTAGTGFTLRENNPSSSFCWSEDLTQGSAGTVQAKFSPTDTGSWVTFVMALKDAGVVAARPAPLQTGRGILRPYRKLNFIPPSPLPAAANVVLFDQIATAPRISSPSQDSSPVDFTNMTVGTGTNRALLATIGFWGVGSNLPTGVTVTWDQGGSNQSMTLLGSQSSTTTGLLFMFFGLLNPVSGNKTMRMAWTGGATPAQTTIDAIAFSNVNQSSLSLAFPNFVTNQGASGTTTSVDVTSAAGHIPVAMTGIHFSAFSITAPNKTVLYTDNNSSCSNAAQYDPVTASSTTTFSWTYTTSAPWFSMGIDTAPPAAVTNYVMPAGTGTITLAGQTARLAVDRRMAAGLGTLTLAGQIAITRFGARVVAGLGTLTLSGQQMVLSRSRIMPAGLGTLTLAGQTVSLRAARRMTMGLGTLTLSGQTVNAKYGHNLVAGLGTLTLSGQAAVLRYNHIMTAGTGILTLTGQTVGLLYAVGYRLVAGTGTLVTSGQNVTLSYARKVPFGQGTITLSGQNVTLARSRTMAAGTGTLTISGQAAATKYGRNLVAGLGTLTLSGQTIIARYTRVMPAGLGTLTLSGQTVNLKRSYVLSTGLGVLTLSGQTAKLEYGRVVPHGQGILTLSGQTVKLAWAHKGVSGTGTIVISGQTVNLIYSGAGSKIMPAGTGTIALSGQTTTLAYGRKMPSVNGTITIGGQSVALLLGRRATVAKGDIILSGQTALLRYGHKLAIPAEGRIVLAGQDVTLTKAAGGPTGRAKVWNGTAWVTKPVKVWNGSAWVTKPAKVWNGSVWR